MGRARHLEHHTGYVRRHGRHVLVVVRNLYFIYDCTTFFTRYIGRYTLFCSTFFALLKIRHM